MALAKDTGTRLDMFQRFTPNPLCIPYVVMSNITWYKSNEMRHPLSIRKIR
jgi:hypothetical protein